MISRASSFEGALSLCPERLIFLYEHTMNPAAHFGAPRVHYVFVSIILGMSTFSYSIRSSYLVIIQE